MAVIHINKEAFLKRVWDFEKNPKEWKFLGDKPALVDFFATWCGPCRMLSPVLEELSEAYAGKIDIYKVDVDEEEALAAAFGVSSIPTLLFCPKNGQPQMTQGFRSSEDLSKIIDSFLLK